MTHKGYKTRTEFDAEDQIFFGRVIGIRDGIRFHADDMPRLQAAFHEAIDDYLDNRANDRDVDMAEKEIERG